MNTNPDLKVVAKELQSAGYKIFNAIRHKDKNILYVETDAVEDILKYLKDNKSIESISTSCLQTPNSNITLIMYPLYIEKQDLQEKSSNMKDFRNGVKIPGYTNTWGAIDSITLKNGMTYHLMENEKYGDETTYLVINNDMSEVYETYDDLLTCLADEDVISFDEKEEYETERASDESTSDKLHAKVYDWYKSEYPDDYQLDRLDRSTTFGQVKAALDMNMDLEVILAALDFHLDQHVIDRVVAHLEELQGKKSIKEDIIGRTDIPVGTHVRGKDAAGNTVSGIVTAPGYWEGAVIIAVDNPPKIPRRTPYISDDDYREKRKNAFRARSAIITDVEILDEALKESWSVVDVDTGDRFGQYKTPEEAKVKANQYKQLGLGKNTIIRNDETDEVIKESIEKKLKTPRGTFDIYDGSWNDFKNDEKYKDWGMWFEHFLPEDADWKNTTDYYKIMSDGSQAIAVLYMHKDTKNESLKESANPSWDRVYVIRVKYPDGRYEDVEVLGYDYNDEMKDRIRKKLGNDIEFSGLNPMNFYSLSEYISKKNPQIIVESLKEEKENKMTFEDFLNHCDAKGGNWVMMLLSGIKKVFPEKYEEIKEKYSLSFTNGIRDFGILLNILKELGVEI